MLHIARTGGATLMRDEGGPARHRRPECGRKGRSGRARTQRQATNGLGNGDTARRGQIRKINHSILPRGPGSALGQEPVLRPLLPMDASYWRKIKVPIF